MFNFKDFEVISYQPSAFKTYEPSVTICDRKMIFGSVCFVRLGKPEYVRLMFDPKGKRIAVQGSNKKTKDSIYLNPERKCKQFGIYGQGYVPEICKLMPNWKSELRYNIIGEYYEDENVLVFDMNKAVASEVIHKNKMQVKSN